MTPADYVEALKERLVTDAVAANFAILRERVTDSEAPLRARITLINGSTLEFSEYAQIGADDQMLVVTYSYHWADARDALIQRWDNTPHFPTLSNFPHHSHTGPDNTPVPAQPMTLFTVLDEIARQLA
jgi:Family of unknown function (DUF6516)